MGLDFTESYPIIQWDLNNQALFKYYNGSVDDSGNGFKLQIIQGSTILVPSTEDAFFYFRKADNTKGYIEATISGDYFVFKLTNQVYAVAGQVPCNFQITQGSEWKTSPTFTITVNDNNIQDSIESSDDFIAFQNALNSLGDITQEVNEAVTNANQAISTINTTNTSVQNSENIRVTSENQRIADENTRMSNEDARIVAEDLRPDYYYKTQAEYDALPQEDKDNPKNIYEITDNDGVLPNELQNLITEAQEATEAAWQAASGSLPDFGTAGTYNKVTTDSKGRVQSGSLETTVSGLGITNVYTKSEINTITGDLSLLETVENTDLVEAVNEVNATKISNTKIANNLVTNTTGFVLDATQGKNLQDQITTVNNSLTTKLPLSTTALDPNTVTSAQCFYMSGSINAPSFFPNDHSGYCICFAFNNDYCTQFAMSFFGSKIACRSRNGGVWEEWAEK